MTSLWTLNENHVETYRVDALVAASNLIHEGVAVTAHGILLVAAVNASGNKVLDHLVLVLNLGAKHLLVVLGCSE